MAVSVIRKKKSIEVPIGIECSLDDFMDSFCYRDHDFEIEAEGGRYHGNTKDDKFEFYSKTGAKLKTSDIKMRILPSDDALDDSFSNID